MTLRIVFDCDPERLAERCVEALSPSGAKVLASDKLIVPSLSVANWLEQRIGARYGISALLDVTLGGRYIWSTLEDIMGGLPPRSPFESEKARWAVLELLENLPANQPDLSLLRTRVAQMNDRERFVLSESIAQLFDRYLAFRRDWISCWDRGQQLPGLAGQLTHAPWQRWLWNALRERLPNVAAEHPFDRFARLVASATDPAARASLARAMGEGRIFLFGALSVSPEQFRLLAEFGRLRELVWFVPDPSMDFWEDLLSPVEAARLAGTDPEQSWLYASQPSILGAWGKSARDFLAQLRLLEGDFDIQIDESFREQASSPPGFALAALRESVRRLDDAVWDDFEAVVQDQSIQVHSTHGEIRQAEILHDRLLDCFDRMPDLEPGQIVVYCADTERLGPAIEAVFSATAAARHIPVRIAGRSSHDDAAARAVRQFLALAVGPMHVGAVLDLLANPLVRARSGLDDEQFRHLAQGFMDAGIRRDELAEPESQKHGWRAGMERIVLGILGSDAITVVGGRLRVARSGFGDSQGLAWVLELLAQSRALGEAPLRRELARWVELVLLWCERFLGNEPGASMQMAPVRDALAQLVSSAQGLAGPISLASFAQAVDASLSSAAPLVRASGEVTVCRLGALPGVPFRVTAMLGMEEGAWPRATRPLEFDLMRSLPRFGDRLVRFDDRGAFLDAVLAARERLIVVYTGRDVRDDSKLNPSVLVRELCDYLHRVWPGFAGVRSHSLQAFSAANFAHAQGGPSYASEWLAAARATRGAASERSGLRPVAAADISVADDAVSGASVVPAMRSIAGIVDDLASPSAAYCRHGLGIERADAAMVFDERTPIDVYRIDAAWLGTVLGPVWRGDCTLAQMTIALRDSPSTPAGSGGDILSEQVLALIDGALALRAQVLRSFGLDPANSNEQRIVRQDPVHGIRGQLTGVYDNRVQFVLSPFPRHARAAIEAWLRHALWTQALASDHTDMHTVLIHLDASRKWVYQTVRPGLAADAVLAHAAGWGRRARAQPLALFPRPMFKAIDKACTEAGLDEALARDAFESLYLSEPWGKSAATQSSVEAIWRAGLPAVAEAFEFSYSAYRPAFAALASERPRRRSKAQST